MCGKCDVPLITLTDEQWDLLEWLPLLPWMTQGEQLRLLADVQTLASVFSRGASQHGPRGLQKQQKQGMIE